jgi:hypothetical protein
VNLLVNRHPGKNSNPGMFRPKIAVPIRERLCGRQL